MLVRSIREKFVIKIFRWHLNILIIYNGVCGEHGSFPIIKAAILNKHEELRLLTRISGNEKKKKTKQKSNISFGFNNAWSSQFLWAVKFFGTFL